MCFHSKQSKSAQELQNRFNARLEQPESYAPSVYNGFQHPFTPVITHKESEKIQLYRWGLIPHWAKDDGIKKYTLNARIETIREKPAFRTSVNHRCLVLADGFFEWQWLDEKGKKKQKYIMTMPGDEAFAFAGLWSEWPDLSTGELIHTYTILTMEANELMSRIHNNKKRMPVILSAETEASWLRGEEYSLSNDDLVATPAG